MSYCEKVAYCKQHNIPGTIDEWISAGKSHTEAPIANPHNSNPYCSYAPSQDNVECTLSVLREEVEIFQIRAYPKF